MSNGSYEQSPYRFPLIICFILAVLVGQLPSDIFSAISTLLQQRFQLPALLITTNYLVFPFLHFIFFAPINWFTTKKGIKLAVYAGSSLLILGSWLRTTLSTSNPYLCILGSCLIAIGNMFLGSCTNKIVVNWFRAELFSTTIFIISVFMAIGQSGGLFLPGFIFKSQSTQEQIIKFLRIIALVLTVPFILLMIVIRQKPDKPPSKSAELQQKIQEKNYYLILKQLFKNKNFLRLAITSCFYGASITILLSTYSDYLTGLGYKQPALVISETDLSCLGFGILGILFFGTLVKKTKKYKLLTTIFIGTTLGLIILNLGYIEGFKETWQIILTASLFGFCSYARIGMFSTFSVQIAFPIDQASIGGYFNGISHSFGSVVSFVIIPFVSKTRSNSQLLALLMVVFQVIGLVFVYFVKQDLRKDNYEAGIVQQKSFMIQYEQAEQYQQAEQQESPRRSLANQQIV